MHWQSSPRVDLAEERIDNLEDENEHFGQDITQKMKEWKIWTPSCVKSRGSTQKLNGLNTLSRSHRGRKGLSAGGRHSMIYTFRRFLCWNLPRRQPTICNSFSEGKAECWSSFLSSYTEISAEGRNMFAIFLFMFCERENELRDIN